MNAFESEAPQEIEKTATLPGETARANPRQIQEGNLKSLAFAKDDLNPSG